MTKKEIYAKRGIEYDPKTGNISHNEFGWIKPLLKEGNSKTGKRVYTFSLPAGTDGTCICDCPNCYAKTGFYCVQNVKDSLKRNQNVIESDITFAENAILAQIEADKIAMVRIHAAGDFNTKNRKKYAAMWHEIVALNPDVKFWTYTKIKEFETLFDGFTNANIVPSVLPFNLGFNFGTCGELLLAYETLKKHGIEAHICECGIDPNHHCQTCAGCSTNKYVLFILHSTKDYDASIDILLPEIRKIIESQNA